MHKALWASCLWPGLAQIWLRGAWSGLALAVGFSLLVNLLLVSSLVWTELVTPAVRLAGWTVVSLYWVGSVVGSWWWLSREQPELRLEKTVDRFRIAQREYLRCNWLEAERLLGEILADDDRDVAAGLLLATLLRHTGRFPEAGRELARLARLDDATAWQFEIERERQLMSQHQSGAEDTDLDETPAETTEAAAA